MYFRVWQPIILIYNTPKKNTQYFNKNIIFLSHTDAMNDAIALSSYYWLYTQM